MFQIGGQEHFYLETNATLAVPGEAGSLEVFASTQNPTLTQDSCSQVCGIDKNKVGEVDGAGLYGMSGLGQLYLLSCCYLLVVVVS